MENIFKTGWNSSEKYGPPDSSHVNVNMGRSLLSGFLLGGFFGRIFCFEDWVDVHAHIMGDGPRLSRAWFGPAVGMTSSRHDKCPGFV